MMDPRVMAHEGVEQIERLKAELLDALADEADAASRASALVQELTDLGVDAGDLPSDTDLPGST